MECRAAGGGVRGSRSASTAVWSGSHGGWFQRLLSERPSAERCVEVPLTTEWVTIAPAPDRYVEVAAAAITREALRRALMPVINSISVTGVISLPGMMTGQILGGVPLAEVVKCQILVMFLRKNGTLRPCPLSTGIRLLLRNNHPSPPGCD